MAPNVPPLSGGRVVFGAQNESSRLDCENQPAPKAVERVLLLTIIFSSVVLRLVSRRASLGCHLGQMIRRPRASFE